MERIVLFASFYLERPPLQWQQAPQALVVWIQYSGGLAAIGIALYFLARAVQPDAKASTILTFPKRLEVLSSLIRYAVIFAGIGYGLLILQWLGIMAGITGLREVQAMEARNWISLFSALAALLAVLAPFVIDLITRISWRRIWAIARLSWTER